MFSKKIRFLIYLILLFVTFIYIVFFNANTPSKQLFLTNNEYKLLEERADNNDTDALKKLYKYYRFYVRDENITIDFLEKYQSSNNNFINYTFAVHLLNQNDEYNIKKAMNFIKKSAKQGHIDSQKLLSNFYRTGRYVEVNEELARYWENQAKIKPYSLQSSSIGVYTRPTTSK